MCLLVYLTPIRKEKTLLRTELPHSKDEEEELSVDNEDSDDEGKPLSLPASLVTCLFYSAAVVLSSRCFSGANAQ